MAKKPPPPEPISSRRNFLKGGVLLGGATLAGGGLWALLKDSDEPPLDELVTFTGYAAADVSYPIDQNQINEQYHLIYNKIKEARDSNTTGKPLTIIMGENHTGTHALITELMVLSAAKRLGIKTHASEDTKESLDNFIKGRKAVVQKRDELVPTVEADLNPQHDPKRTTTSRSIVDAFIISAAIRNSRTDGQLWLPSYMGTDAILKDYRLISIDPLHNEIKSSVREPAMVDSMLAIPEDYIATIGFAHAGNIAQALRKEGRAVLLIDTTNINFDMSKENEDVRKRFEASAKETDLRIVINGQFPESIQQIFAHAAAAEINFDYANDPHFRTRATQTLLANLEVELSSGRGR